MFVERRRDTRLTGAMHLLEVMFHATVRKIRQNHGNAVIGLALNILQTLVLVMAFYVLFKVVGIRGSKLRGDFLLYLMSGIFLFLTHNKTLGAVVGSEGPTSPMMKHAPMNTLVAIVSSALSVLYLQILSMAVVLYVYHAAFKPITIDEPVGALAMMLLAWLSGAAVGVLLLAVRPWAPSVVSLVTTVYQRANMVASGKMFVANSLPGHIIVYFLWNPLFHTIDQARGFTFLNYNPHFTWIAYPVQLSLALIMIGLLGEFFTRKHVSLSWSAKD